MNRRNEIYALALNKHPLQLAIYYYRIVKDEYYEYENRYPVEDFEVEVVEIANFLNDEMDWTEDQIEQFIIYVEKLVPNKMIAD